eukprot:7336478-Lingulodinium_polyedra.AAC.1
MYQEPQSGVCPPQPWGSPAPRQRAKQRRPTKGSRLCAGATPPRRRQRPSGPGAVTCSARLQTA